MPRHQQEKIAFKTHLSRFVEELTSHIATPDGDWTIKGFIDVFRNIYTLSTDTKLVSKILEIHLLPPLLDFAQAHGYYIVLPEQQNYSPRFVFRQRDG